MTDSYHFRHVIVDLISGTLGGTACVFVGQPLDTVKVKMQAFPFFYKSGMHCFQKTFIEEGLFRGLYAGTVPSLIANIAENSVLFAAYGFCQKFVQYVNDIDDVQKLSILQNATAGSLAAFFSSFSLCPTELIKCKLQAQYQITSSPDQVRQYTSPWALTRQIIQNDGFKGLFRGIGTTIAREMPGYFFFFGGYEGCRELLRLSDQRKDDIGLYKTMVSGAVGGLCFWTFIFPADMIKSRIQILDHNSNLSVIEYTRTVFKNEGIRAFYSGLMPTLLRTIPTTAVLFVVVEYSKKFLHDLMSA